MDQHFYLLSVLYLCSSFGVKCSFWPLAVCSICVAPVQVHFWPLDEDHSIVLLFWISSVYAVWKVLHTNMCASVHTAFYICEYCQWLAVKYMKTLMYRLFFYICLWLCHKDHFVFFSCQMLFILSRNLIW